MKVKEIGKTEFTGKGRYNRDVRFTGGLPYRESTVVVMLRHWIGYPRTNMIIFNTTVIYNIITRYNRGFRGEAHAV